MREFQGRGSDWNRESTACLRVDIADQDRRAGTQSRIGAAVYPQRHINITLRPGQFGGKIAGLIRVIPEGVVQRKRAAGRWIPARLRPEVERLSDVDLAVQMVAKEADFERLRRVNA